MQGFVPLANFTLSTSATSVTFSSISQSYRDLILIVSNMTSSSNALRFKINGDTGVNYRAIRAEGNGSSTYSTTTNNNGYYFGTYSNSDEGTSPNIVQVNFMDSNRTNKHKTFIYRGSSISGPVASMSMGRWVNTAAITSITIDSGISSLAGSTFALYGVVA